MFVLNKDINQNDFFKPIRKSFFVLKNWYNT